ncbi:S1C family serine protease [Salirhabdus salicampi]|uniref:S1C family serine protease n=1 Tax=Salirhabdus salicampi TaxID=476102 RepID=UPI0020C34FB9|nr:trypsin-like peptidase domain-containing protein [Salirhabdus salicampi]MCP8616015.1 S1C family serine protease [Salirhabdus salicampi]
MDKHQLKWPLLATGIILFIVVMVISSYWQTWVQQSVPVSNDIAELVSDSSSEPDTKDLKTIIHESQKFVVQIEAEGESGQSIGSGFIYNNQGDIITNAHVVQGADSIYVKTSDARTYPAALIGIGTEEDVALIRVPQLIDRSPNSVNPDFEADIGDEIIAVGSPLGFQNTVTVGIISGKNRSFSIQGYDYNNAYQISASITNGNSGGPLIHRQTGQIIAINSAGTKEGTMGFSIPLNNVYDLVQMWTDQAENMDLEFNVDSSIYDKVSPEQLEEEAKYIIDYFFKSINLRDYFNAYALLGSDRQNETSYQEFRENYIQIMEINKQIVNYELLSNNRMKFTIEEDRKMREQGQGVVTEHYQSEFTVGYENDQIKILHDTQTLISITEHESEPNREE